MSEPASTAAGGIAAWKIGAGILGIGVVTSALGFMVLLPRSPKEAALRALATMAGSALFGPLLVIAAYSHFPEVFASAVKLADSFGVEPTAGLFMAGAPLLALAGLPFWWILGAVVLWLDKRRGKDIGEIAADVRADIKGAMS